MRKHPLYALIGVSLVAGVVATLGFEILTNVVSGGRPLVQVSAESLCRLADQPLIAIYLIAPFALLGCICAAVAHLKNFDGGVGVLLLGLLLLGFLYFNGYEDAQSALRNRRWTGAALSVGLLPFLSAPILLLCVIVGVLVRKRDATDAA